MRDFGLDPDDDGREQAYVFHAVPAGTMSVSRDERAHARQSGPACRASAGHCRHRRCAIARPGGAAAERMGPATRYEPDRDCRSAGRGDGAGPVSVGAGHLLAGVDQRLTADARNRPARRARRQPAPSACRHPVARSGAHGERHHGGRGPSALVRRTGPGPLGPSCAGCPAFRRLSWQSHPSSCSPRACLPASGPPAAHSGSIPSMP